MIIIKCISLWEPWGWAMAEPLKLIETRSFGTNHRGWLGIHAAKIPAETAIKRTFAGDPAGEKRFRELLASKGWTPDKASYGKMVCIVDLNLVIKTEWCSANISDLEFAFGNYAMDRFAWKTRKENHIDLRPFNLAVTGRQGLFNWVVAPGVEQLLSKKTPTQSILF